MLATHLIVHIHPTGCGCCSHVFEAPRARACLPCWHHLQRQPGHAAKQTRKAQSTTQRWRRQLGKQPALQAAAVTNSSCSGADVAIVQGSWARSPIDLSHNDHFRHRQDGPKASRRSSSQPRMPHMLHCCAQQAQNWPKPPGSRLATHPSYTGACDTLTLHLRSR